MRTAGDPVSREQPAPAGGGTGPVVRVAGVWPDLALVLGVGLVGLLPHVLFSVDVGALAYFKDAWDEDFYLLQAVAGWPPHPHRLLSMGVLRLCRLLAGGNLEGALVVADVLVPTGLALAALYFARAVTRAPAPRVGLALALLLATDVVSLSSMAVWGEGLRARAAFESLPLVRWLPSPVAETTFLMLYRSPEPAASWAVALVALGHLARRLTAGRDRARGLGLVLLNLALPFVYVFVAVAILLIEGTTAVLLLGRAGSRPARPPGLIAGTLAGAAALGIALGLAPLSAGAGQSFFPSRLPAVSPAVVLGVGLGLLHLARTRWRGPTDGRGRLALACLALPVVIENQQLVTGVMLQAKAWEQYGDYLFLVAGAGLLAGIMPWPAGPARSRWLAAGLVGALALLLVSGRLATFRIFAESNRASLAQARALVAARAAGGPARLVLEQPDDDGLLSVRLGARLRPVRGYLDVMDGLHPIANMPRPGGVPAGRDVHVARAFEHLARVGIEPAGLEAEVRSGHVPQLRAFFSQRDSIPSHSGHRALRADEIRRQAPDIALVYTASLEAPPGAWREPALYLSGVTTPLRAALNPRFDNVLLARGAAGRETPARAWAYAQTLRPVPRAPRELLAEWRARAGVGLMVAPSAAGGTLVDAVDPSAPLPATIWSSEGGRLLVGPDGLEVVTPPGRFAYALSVPALMAPAAGHYAFFLAWRPGEGGMAFGALTGDRRRWLGQAAPLLPAGDGDAVLLLELDLAAGQAIVLMLTNAHPGGDTPSRFVLRGLSAVRVREPAA